MECVLRSRLRPDAALERPHLCWHTIISLKLKYCDLKGAYLQMSNQLDLDVGSHGKLLDSYARSALERISVKLCEKIIIERS